MKLSQNPELICLRLDVSPATACGIIAQPDGIASRHAVEKSLQALFYDLGIAAYVHEGEGTFLAGHIFILTDAPAATLRELKRALQTFVIEGAPVDLLPFAHIGWLDKSCDLWRTFHPRTTRSFWTHLEPDTFRKAMERGEAIRKLKILIA